VTVQLKLRVRAVGSTDAADRAKAEARRRGHRVQTVASIRPANAHKASVDLHRVEAGWIVVLAVREP